MTLERATRHVCQLQLPVTEPRSWIWVRAGVAALIEAEAPGRHDGELICRSDLARFRRIHVEPMLEDRNRDRG